MDRPSDIYRKLIRDQMAHYGLSFRELSRISGLDRKILGRFVRGQTNMTMDHLETALAVFGYELDAIPRRRAA